MSLSTTESSNSHAAPDAAHDPAGNDAGHVLVVDDDPSIRGLVAEILESEGYVVQTAANGAEALPQILAARPAVVLLDMRMPVLDGWGLARELAARGVKVPVLVMTAARDARHWAAEIEADGYLAKPFELIDLLDAVERFIQPDQ